LGASLGAKISSSSNKSFFSALVSFFSSFSSFSGSLIVTFYNFLKKKFFIYFSKKK